MDATYNKEDMLNHLGLIKPDDFTLTTDGIYEKIESEVKFALSFGKEKYFPFSVVYSGVLLSIRFIAVENIINEVANNTGLSEYSSDTNDYTFSKSFWKNILGPADRKRITDIEVTDNASFELIKPTLILIRDAALTWLSNHNTLQSCYDFGETLTLDERSRFYGHPFSLLYMTVKKVLNSIDYESYSSNLISNITNRGETQKAAFYQAIKNY